MEEVLSVAREAMVATALMAVEVAMAAVATGVAKEVGKVAETAEHGTESSGSSYHHDNRVTDHC